MMLDKLKAGLEPLRRRAWKVVASFLGIVVVALGSVRQCAADQSCPSKMSDGFDLVTGEPNCVTWTAPPVQDAGAD